MREKTKVNYRAKFTFARNSHHSFKVSLSLLFISSLIPHFYGICLEEIFFFPIANYLSNSGVVGDNSPFIPFEDNVSNI